MVEDRGTWDRMKGKTNDAVGGARGDLGQQMRGKGQQVKGAVKDAMSSGRRRRDEPRT